MLIYIYIIYLSHKLQITMLKYFLDQELKQTDQSLKNIIKTRFIKKRQYHPFHLDCAYTKKKLCYCPSHPISKISGQNKAKLWQTYEEYHDYYMKIDGEQKRKAFELYKNCRQKIRHLSKSQVGEFVRNLKNDKNMHMGQNGEYQNS